MQVEIFSDVVCPWCYIGKRRFEQALERFPHAGEVQVTWRSFELDSAAPRGTGGPTLPALARKYGMTQAHAAEMQAHMTEVAAEVGLDFHLDLTRKGNTVDAHRLLHLAAEHGVQGQVKERLLKAYFTEGRPVFTHADLARLGAEAGLDADVAARALADGSYATEVAADLDLARSFGISGVPFFVVDRAYGVSGAQPAQALLQVLEQAWAASHPLTMVSTGSGGTCDDGSCVV